MLKSVLLAGALAGALVVAGAANAAELQVHMKNQGAQGMMVFEPATAKIKPGDTIRFIPDVPGHNVESIPEMLPPGAEVVKGQMGKEVIAKFPKAGVYGFKCMPHWGLGMVFIAKVGDGKLDPAKANAVLAAAPPMAKKRLTADFAAIK